MNRHFMRTLWLIPLGVIVSVLASLAGVWLLSAAVGFRFMPVLVAAFGGSFGALMGSTSLWRKRP